jgi:long-subunit acyl-CoA synthetase (AMP-forming)
LSCGRLCPGIDLKVTDDSGKQVEVGKPGELVARGANVMRGYWNNPAETALAFRDGSFRTGDIGSQDSEGYFYILDRAKDMIVTAARMSIPVKSKLRFTRIRQFARLQFSEYPIPSGAK